MKLLEGKAIYVSFQNDHGNIFIGWHAYCTYVTVLYLKVVFAVENKIVSG